MARLPVCSTQPPVPAERGIKVGKAKTPIRAAERLAALGIDTSKPGFYNDPAFLEAEKKDPTLLMCYANFVDELALPDSYLGGAEQVLRATVAYFEAELRADGRKGACIDAAMVMSTCLNSLGVWNYAVKGALRVDLNPNLGSAPAYFWPLVGSRNPAQTGHAWVVAPPFRIIDATIHLQPYLNGQERHILGPLLATRPDRASYVANDLGEPGCIQEFRQRYGRSPTLEDLDRHVQPGVLGRIDRLGAFIVPFAAGTGTYIGCGVLASEESSLGQMKNLVLRGKPPQALFAELQAKLIEAGLAAEPLSIGGSQS